MGSIRMCGGDCQTSGCTHNPDMIQRELREPSDSQQSTVYFGLLLGHIYNTLSYLPLSLSETHTPTLPEHTHTPMMLGSRELVPLFIVLVGHRLRFLSLSGSIGAFFIGIFVLDGGWMVGGQLIGFFLVGSFATKVKQGEKEDAMPYPETEEEEARRRRKKEEDVKRNDVTIDEKDVSSKKNHHVRTGRDIYQVFATGLIPALICMTRSFFPTLDDNNNNNDPSIDPSHLRQPWYLAYLAYVACCCGDTLASEIGMLSTQQPMMLLQKKTVQRGVDGGMTLLGTFASLIGGGFVGAFGWNWYDIYLGCIYGCLGGLFDSILGTLVQSKEYMEPSTPSASSSVDPDTGFIDATITNHGQLSLTPKRWKQLNNIVNLVSSFLTAILAIGIQTLHIEYGINFLPEFELIIMLLFLTLTPSLKPVPTGLAILILFLLLHPTHIIEFIVTFIIYVIWRIR